jgi:hypothetical protein
MVLNGSGNRENAAAIKDGTGQLLTDSIEKGQGLSFLLFFSIQL